MFSPFKHTLTSYKVYSGETSPFGPTSLLYTMWRSSPTIDGYAQHDAHEFFIAALDQLHETSIGSTSISCNCIVHGAFEGHLQSVHVCDGCESSTSKIDPMRDISLQLKAGEEDTLAGCLRRSGMSQPDEHMISRTLARFTQAESVKYNCSKCGSSSQVRLPSIDSNSQK